MLAPGVPMHQVQRCSRLWSVLLFKKWDVIEPGEAEHGNVFKYLLVTLKVRFESKAASAQEQK